MKRLWRGINEGLDKVEKYVVIRFAVMVFCIFLMCCARKGQDRVPTEDCGVRECSDGRGDPAEGNCTVDYQPTGFRYNYTMEPTNAEDEYNDSLDYYLDDPEDELRFDPEIFEFQDE